MRFFVALAVFLAAFSFPVYAQQVCGPRDEALKHLSKKYHEHPAAVGVASGGKVMEIIASTKGSWTMLATSPDGNSCAIASGTGWQILPPPRARGGFVA